jgi:hypothetical protein
MSKYNRKLSRGTGTVQSLVFWSSFLALDHKKNNLLHPAAVGEENLLKDCEISATRRSGPGGQHRNKVETAVIITHRSTGISAEASERRSRSENLKKALFRLRVNLALNVRSQRQEESRPSLLWQSRCLNKRIAVNSGHVDFPALLAEGLDTVFHCELNLKSAAEQLRCTSSQLVSFLKKEPRAWEMVNRHRVEHGLHRLK